MPYRPRPPVYLHTRSDTCTVIFEGRGRPYGGFTSPIKERYRGSLHPTRLGGRPGHPSHPPPEAKCSESGSMLIQVLIYLLPPSNRAYFRHPARVPTCESCLGRRAKCENLCGLPLAAQCDSASSWLAYSCRARARGLTLYIPTLASISISRPAFTLRWIE
jgi:hypothetical protein